MPSLSRKNEISFSSTESAEFPHVVNDEEIDSFDEWMKCNKTAAFEGLTVPFSPPLTFEKFITMQVSFKMPLFRDGPSWFLTPYNILVVSFLF